MTTTVLIVDDRRVDREYLAAVLGYRGDRLLEAADGAEALRVARAEHPDLIISDLVMPTMDGYEFAHQLRGSTNAAVAHIPIIFYTASYNPREARTLARSAGVEYVLSKPSEPAVILDMVNKALDHAPAPKLAKTGPLVGPPAFVNRVAQTTDDVDQLSRRLSDIIDFGLQLARERDPERLLQSLCEAARALAGARYAAVAILDEDGQTLRHFVTSGFDEATTASIGHWPTGGGLLGQLLTSRQTAIRNRTSKSALQKIFWAHGGLPRCPH